MKKVEIIINEDGSYEIDCKEGFAGVSCDKKTLEIISICGGAEKDAKRKDEWYDGNGDNFDEIINRR
jgi:hypothetical protein